MQIDVFSLCDAATADRGKLNILGAFDTIWVTSMPAAQGKINFPAPSQQRGTSTNLILDIQNLRIERLGEYSIEVSVDGKNLAAVPLYVKKRETGTAP